MLRKVVLGIFIILLLLLKTPYILAYSIPDELSFGNEQYSLTDSIKYNNKVYQIITYQNGDTIVLDASESLVTNPNILNDVYLIRGYKIIFLKYGIEKSKFSIISEAINSYYDSLEILKNPALPILATFIGTISLPIIGTISLPVIVGVLSTLAENLRNGAKIPKSTVDRILENFVIIERGDASPKTYEEILQLSMLLRNQLNDWSGQFMILGYNVWGSLGDILYKIGDAGSNFPIVGNIAKDIKNAGSRMMESQKILTSSINWLSTLQVEQIKSDANTLANTMINSQEQRIKKLQEDFNSLSTVVYNDLAQAQTQINNAALQGADVTAANLLLQQASLKLEQAKSQVNNYYFKTAKSTLNDTSKLISDSKLALTLAINIHEIELKIEKIQEVINQKNAMGIDVSNAQKKLNDAKTALSNAKSFLSSIDFYNTKNQISVATSLAEEALNIANALTSTPKMPFVAQLELEHILLVILVIIVILIILLVYIILKKRTKI
ncbi:MAG: hypothetical protein QXO82_05620 [Candidatus Methanomethylicia archaeon]